MDALSGMPVSHERRFPVIMGCQARSHELYRISEDPGEYSDLKQQEKEIFVRMSEQMNVYWEDVEVGGLDDRVSVGGDVPVTHVIDEQENDIGDFFLSVKGVAQAAKETCTTCENQSVFHTKPVPADHGFLDWVGHRT